jgi:ornithine decarboxylase
VKSNPDRALLKTLSSLGSGFDCASGKELLEVAEVQKGEFKDNVVYANPCKPMRDLQMAKSLGAPTTVVDSFEEVDKLKSVKWGGNALLRILVEDENSLMPFSRKFGLPSEKASDLAIYAKSKGIALKGVICTITQPCTIPYTWRHP